MPAWLILTFVALLSWGAWAVLSKVAGDALSPEQSQALSTLGMLPLLVPLALSKRAPLRGVSRRGLLFALIGGVVTCLGNVAYYAALARGEKVATVVSLTALYPLVARCRKRYSCRTSSRLWISRRRVAVLNLEEAEDFNCTADSSSRARAPLMVNPCS